MLLLDLTGERGSEAGVLRHAETSSNKQTHMATREFIGTVLLLCSSALVLAQNQTTYLRRLPSGQKVQCDRCLPGFYLQAHCTENKKTECRPCDEGFYTEYWNYISSCLPCRQCSSDQVIVQECTSSTNRVCACKEGFYWDSYVCRQHTVCSRGYGVKEKGTLARDTVCEPCEDGYYSAGHTHCLPHTVCNSEENLLFCGTNILDNVCFTCNNITRYGWVKYINQNFIELFKNQNSRKLHRFIKVLTNSEDFDADRDSSIQQLQQWFSQATEQQVESLYDMLQECKMRHLATKIQQRIKKIHHEVSLCKNGF